MTSPFSLAGPETPSARPSLRAVDLHGPRGPSGGALERRRAWFPLCRARLPSASARRRHHAQQSRLPRHEGAQRARMGTRVGRCCASTFAAPASAKARTMASPNLKMCSRRSTGSIPNTTCPSSLPDSVSARPWRFAACCRDRRKHIAPHPCPRRPGLPTQASGRAYQLSVALCDMHSAQALSQRRSRSVCTQDELQQVVDSAAEPKTPGVHPRRRSFLHRSTRSHAAARSQTG